MRAADDAADRDRWITARHGVRDQWILAAAAAVLQIWTELPDEAIAALSQLLYALRAAPPAGPGAGQRWYWNGGTRRWELLRLPPLGDAAGPATPGAPE
ncbi:MAG TPA: hypothetical protein VGG35_19570 [Streptosporangiaceae bacterium]